MYMENVVSCATELSSTKFNFKICPLKIGTSVKFTAFIHPLFFIPFSVSSHLSVKIIFAKFLLLSVIFALPLSPTACTTLGFTKVGVASFPSTQSEFDVSEILYLAFQF